MIFSKKKKSDPQRILIIRFSSIGDIVLTTPVVRALRRRFPHAEIHFLIREPFREVMTDNPYIDMLHIFDKDLDQNIKTLHQLNFDLVIDLQKNFRSRKVRHELNVKSYTFPKLNIQKWLYTNLKWNTLPDTGIVNRYFKAIAKTGAKNDGEGLDYFIPEEKETVQDDIPMGHWAGFVGCVIGGSFATKQFPAEKWQALLGQIPYPAILLGGPGDRDMGAAIAAVNPGKIYNACGKFSLTESAHLVQRAKVIVSNDTGLMHIAAAFKKPIVSLWGNTTPWLGMFPYYGYNNISQTVAPQSIMMEVKNLSCRPCSKLGYQQCPKKHFKCMNLLQINEIAAAVTKLWAL